ncbi:hypothetical protein EJB05_38465 [Eragrostis curvula]|uniref:Uncharacterized protein n=1 Tax=Eragrostis curvula TaxID=38414 RepID=A0A5J9TVY4_9POAL|nr:hypothetical protein EJB05_38465 [Eragrostis curvula]
MVVHVIYTRREQGGRGKSLVRLAGGAAAVAATASGGRSLSRAGSRTLRATSPPPHASIASPAGWQSRSLRRDGDEDWEEVVAAGPGGAAPEACEEVTDEYKVVFGAPPTDDEVRAAVASIKQVFEKPSAVDSDVSELQALALPVAGHPSSGIFVNHFSLDTDASEIGLEEWIEPAMLVLNSTALLTREHRNVLEAFHLLQEDSSVQKMVMALSTDKTVWDAVMKNEVESDLKGSSPAPGVVKWVLENTQARIKEFLEQILKVVNMLFQAEDKNYDLYDDAVRVSFMLSVFVFIVVTIARIR